jgi:hypothetical protein
MSGNNISEPGAQRSAPPPDLFFWQQSLRIPGSVTFFDGRFFLYFSSERTGYSSHVAIFPILRSENRKFEIAFLIWTMTATATTAITASV